MNIGKCVSFHDSNRVVIAQTAFESLLHDGNQREVPTGDEHFSRIQRHDMSFLAVNHFDALIGVVAFHTL